MSDYRLDRLNTREFEHLTQALCKKFIAPGVTPFGDGADGGREATYDGLMDYPSKLTPWQGYLVIQCKFRQRNSLDEDNDADWAVKELRNELSKYGAAKKTAKAPKNPRRIPKYYIFVTNAVLTPVQDSGGNDRCKKVLEEESKRLGIEGYDIWGFDDLCRYLDGAADIRRAYSGFILPGDVLSRAIEQLEIAIPNFEDVLSKFVQKEFKSDSAAKLQSAGQYDLKHEVALSSVFHDIPFDFLKDSALEPSDEHFELVKYLLKEGDQVIRYGNDRENNGSSGKHTAKNGRYVLVGGPGQGKSTVGQYLCQLYRAVIIRDLKKDRVDDNVRQILSGIESAAGVESAHLPLCRRFPFRLVLNSFASDLANEKGLSIVEYIKRKLERLGGTDVLPLQVLNKWLAGYPWIFILDGLDEVPSSSNRAEVLTAIQDFLVDLTANQADVIVVATTRPQGYSDDFAKDFFQHLYLAPLSKNKALAYGSSLLKERSRGDEEKFIQTQRRMTIAAQNEATVRLMRTPLQVTIMATLVERLGEPPKQRYRLFAEYYRTIYDRESNREGALSMLLNERKTDIDIVHYRTGIFLQSASEKAGGTDATMSLDALLRLVRIRLIDEKDGDVNEIEPLIAEIRAAALERLVFLVSLKDETIGFEIRSLQEFMAAEAICKSASTEVLIKRITEIAPISHWRNVLLFLIGKCFFEDNNPVLDRILLLCDELNEDPNTPEYTVVKWGSRLALDILVDGAARNNPRRERRLVQTALHLLEIPNNGFVGELASIYHAGLELIFREKVCSVIASSEIANSRSAWYLLQHLIGKGVEWAANLFDSKWEGLDVDQRRQVLDSSQVCSNHVLMKKIVSDIPHWDPWNAFSLLDNNRYKIDQFPKHNREGLDVPAWFHAIREIALTSGWAFVPNSLDRPLERRINWISPEVSIGFSFHPMISNKTELVGLDVAEFPYVNEHWIPYVATAKFLRNPCSDTLSDALAMFADYSGAERSGHIAPWPLAAILSLSQTHEELRENAEKARRGHFGGLVEWIEVEKNVINDNNIVENFISIQPSAEMILDQLKIQFPLVATRLEIDLTNSLAVLKKIMSLFKATKSLPIKRWLSECYISQLALHGHKFMPADKIVLSAEDLCEILSASPMALQQLRPTLFDMVELEGDEIASYRIIFEYLGNCDGGISFIYPVRYDEEAWLEAAYRALLETFGPTKEILIWGVKLARAGRLASVPAKMRYHSPAAKDLDSYDRAIIGLGSKDITTEEIAKIILGVSDRVLLGLDIGGDHIVTQLVNASSRLDGEEREKVLVYTAKQLRAQSSLAAHIPISRVCDELERLIKTKKAGFSVSQHRWRELEFPQLS